MVEGKDALKRVKLHFNLRYQQRPLEDVCDQALARWKGIKDEIKSICVKKGIEVLALTCHFRGGQERLWKDEDM